MLRGIIIVSALAVARVAVAQVQVTPVQVQLTPDASSTLITVTNAGAASMRFEVSAKAWAQGPSGDMQLETTKDIAFYPAIFELAPGATRRVRVGSLTPLGRGEKTYRLFIEQLPRFDGQVVGVQVLTRLSLPIFAGASPTAATPTIAEARVENGALKLRVVNAGEAHFSIRSVHISGQSASGSASFDKREAGWYVLSHGERAYAMALDGCQSLAALDVEVETDVSTLRAKVPVAARDCGP